MSEPTGPGARSGPTVIVIGGGIAGLVAARDLDRAGAGVTLMEASDRLGGKLVTSTFAGRPVDEGADAFLVRVPEAAELATAVGLADELTHPAAREAALWWDGALRPLPPTVLGVPTDLDAAERSGLLSPAGRARAEADLIRDRVPLGDRDPSVGDLVADRLGDEVVDRLVDPLIGGITAGHSREQSLAVVAGQLDSAARDPDRHSLIEACRAMRARAPVPAPPVFAAPRTGMGRLVDAVAGDLGAATVVRDCPVAGLAPGAGSGGWAVTTGDDVRWDTDAVVLATPPAITAGLLSGALGAEPAVRVAEAFGELTAASVALVTLAVDPADLPGALGRSGFLVPRAAGIPTITACSFSSTKWAHLAPEHGDGTVVLRVSVGRAQDARALDQDDADLVAAVQADLAVTMGLAGEARASRVSRWPAALPQYRPGHAARTANLETALPPGLAVAGAGVAGVGVPACIRTGHAAAHRVLAAHGHQK